jgi:hypothetical protein
MVGENLHEFDIQLCGYVWGNIQNAMERPAFARYFREVLGAGPLLEYLEKLLDQQGEPTWLLLSDGEFETLISLISDGPIEVGHEWLPYGRLHARYIDTLKEVRDKLTKQTAEEWAAACGRFGKRLKAKQLALPDGIDVVRDWVRHLRQLLKAMGATAFLPCPEGQSPTPTNPAPPPATGPAVPPTPETETVDQEAETLARALARMRALIAEFGMDSPPKKLLDVCGIQGRLARDTLRILQELGEYSGYGRKRPLRYADIRSRYGSVLRRLGISLPDRA